LSHQAETNSRLLPLGVGGLVELLGVVQEAGDAGVLEDATHDRRPALERSEDALSRWPSGREPGAHEDEQRMDEPRPVRLRPVAERRVLEPGPRPRAIGLRVEADAHAAARDLEREVRVVRGDDPGRAVR
jgi:hypothetical protein